MISWRNVGSGRSNATTMPAGLWSLSRLMSIDVNPNTALVTWPLAVAMSVGRAKKARYASEFPSSRRIGATTRSYGRGRPTAYGLRLQLAVQDLVGDLDHLAAGLHRRLLDEVEGL